MDTHAMLEAFRPKGLGRLLVVGWIAGAALGAGTEAPGLLPPRARVLTGRAKAINYTQLRGWSPLAFQGTVLLPEARGSARVYSHEGGSRIRAAFHALAPASRFGGDALTYVLWAVSPLGRATNLGELVPSKSGHCRIEVTTPLQSFGLVVSAEPYFSVTRMSDLLVLKNEPRRETRAQVEAMEVRFEQDPNPRVAAGPEALAPVPRDPKVSPYVHQARNAMRAAREEQAERFAPEEFHRAEALSAELEGMPKLWKRPAVLTARQVVQQAEDARLVALRTRAAETLSSLQRAAETAQQKAAAAQAEAQAAQAQLAEVRAKSSQEVAQARQQASAQQLALRKRLRDQLNLLLQTQDTDQGIVARLSDVSFASGSAQVMPAAREKLAKVAGILLAYPGLKVRVEGHTDATGQPAFNAKLSELRAGRVRDQLLKHGLAPTALVSEGLASSRPVTSEETPQGRQQNRRVELILTGEAIAF